MGVKATKVANISKKHHSDTDSRNATGSFFEDTYSLSSLNASTFYELSITSNFDTYLYMDGRKFYNTSPYVLPSDVIEIRRCDFAHELYKRRWYGNFSSPVDELLKSEGGKVLECGCGSGRWTYEMAVNYPNSTFIGLDMVPIFSNINNNDNKPSNLGFLEYNICNGLPFEEATFDFLFQRSMIISLNKSQWNIMLNEFSRTLKPGGWLELMELHFSDITFTKTAKRFQKALNTYLEINGHYSFHNFPIHNLLRSTNKFSSIKLLEKKVPVGSWGGEFGLKVADVLIEVYEGMKPTIKQIMNVTDSEYDELMHKLSRELKSPLNNYMYITTVRIIAMRNNVPW
ncbi:hypothetical protein RclHR1_00530024 [Rhizophagus clarus]|uniref:Methyltransferase domain-containing protein n=1 Tax=Rhizophagus clarus TaxID=94130 RepID=A0A2Z6SF42_9GLOM|nr:hypothetical protein RclHR1_00530024 [Rhizophagus clarus]